MPQPAGSLVLLDRDGVINRDSPDYIRSVAEWQPLPGSLEAIARLTAAGFQIAVVSNQSGIARGLFSEDTLAAIHRAMRDAVAAAGGRLAGIYYCPHHPQDGCDCRKPRPGLLQRAARDLGVALAGAPFVGDKLSDVEAARAAGARPVLVGPLAEQGAGGRVESYPDLAAAAAALIAERDSAS